MPGKNGQIRPSTKRSVTRGAGSGQHLASVLQEGRENANIDAGLGFIWRISVKLGPRPSFSFCSRKHTFTDQGYRSGQIFDG